MKMSILKYQKYLEEMLESRSYGVQAEVVTFQEVRDLLEWMENLRNIDNTAVRDKIGSMNPTYFRGLQRKLIRLYDEGEIDTSEDAERFILGEKQSLTESKRILHHNEYDKYLIDKEYMKFFNKVKAKILILFPDHNVSNIELLIDKIYTCYVQNYDVDDTVNKLYMSGDLYTFTTKGLDQ
jgi:hypothetical protein